MREQYSTQFYQVRMDRFISMGLWQGVNQHFVQETNESEILTTFRAGVFALNCLSPSRRTFILHLFEGVERGDPYEEVLAVPPFKGSGLLDSFGLRMLEHHSLIYKLPLVVLSGGVTQEGQKLLELFASKSLPPNQALSILQESAKQRLQELVKLN